MHRILIVSPTPSHPQRQGNSARILALGSALRNRGAAITFIYVGMEGATNESLFAMESYWDAFHFVEVPIARRMSGHGHFEIDDWYQDELDPVLDAIVCRTYFDAAIVNYVWLSRAILRLPADCLKIIDTHDVFSDRAAVLKSTGVAPQWFFTDQTEERRGLGRADLILAIQDDERVTLGSITDRPVITVGHEIRPSFRSINPKARSKVTAGCLASGNPLNVRSFKLLEEVLCHRPDITRRVDFRVAGSICQQLSEACRVFKPCGEVDDPATFYDAVDICLNPHIGGTGLKIKSIEALAFGKPFVGTSDATVGLGSDVPAHKCRSIADFPDGIESSLDLKAAAGNSRAVFSSYQQRTSHQLDEFVDIIDQRGAR